MAGDVTGVHFDSSAKGLSRADDGDRVLVAHDPFRSKPTLFYVGAAQGDGTGAKARLFTFTLSASRGMSWVGAGRFAFEVVSRNSDV